jgi:5-hydroxyisourate hydrolase
MGRLTTHVLDTSIGRPAAGVKISLSRFAGDRWSELISTTTNADGRTDKPLAEASDFTAGRYRLEFHIGDYFRAARAVLSDPPFFDVVPVQIGIADPSLHYHVPLLCTPWSYNTYRGS